ncbi:MAG TPA: glycosyltransferase [Vicinamibacterales bacterium]|nr:glycosyltransferase [Vicinamibacterales bacterium]
MNRPNVLQVVLSLNPGGTERLVVELVKRLRPELSMAVCCLDEAGAWGEDLRHDDIDVVALRRREGFRPRLGRAIARAAAQHGARVVHCHHYSPFVYASIARLWAPHLKIVFTEHGRLSDAGPSPKRRTANRVLAHAPRTVVTVSSELKDHLVAEGFPTDKVSVIYNGIDVGPLPDADARGRTRAQLGIADDAFVVGTIARLDPVKDLETLVRAVGSPATRRPVTLLVIGDGPERERLEAAAQSWGGPADSWGGPFRAAVRFLGHRDDARDLLAACDVYANSSISEGISLTILEAMAAGLPVIATHVGGTPEIVDASCGRLVPSRDPESLATTIDQLAGDADLRAALGRAARARVERRFTLDRMIAEYRDAYYAAVA